MTSSTYNISDEQRETCAVNVMRAMLEDYCTETGVPFNQAFFEFSMEGPDYLRNVFEDTRKPTDSASA